MPKKPEKKIPTLEDAIRELGPDAMSFIHDMASPEDPEEHGPEEPPPPKK
jgi:hypothetical protein